MRWECVCGFEPECGTEWFGAEWHAAHRDAHVAAFPDLDARSVRNLELFVEWAS